MSKKAYILIVSDERSKQELLEIFLHREGHFVTAVSGTSEARGRLAGDEFDLVVSDMQMSDGSGLEVVRAVQEHCADVPVIMITEFAATDSAIAAMKEGAYDCVTKPFNVDEFAPVLANALEKNQLAGAYRRLRTELRKGAQELGRGLVGTSTIGRGSQEASYPHDSPIKIVEFFGMMGSGKTSVATLVREGLEREGIPIRYHSDIDDWMRGAGSDFQIESLKLLSSLRLECRAARLALSVEPRQVAHLVRGRRLAGWHRRTRHLAFGNRPLAVQDEGVLHHLLPLTMHGARYSAEALRRLVGGIAKEPHRLFVYVQSDRTLTLQRLRERSSLKSEERSKLWRHATASPTQEQEIYRDLELLVERVNDAIGSVAPDRRIVVDNNRTSVSAAERALACILPIVRNCR